MKVFESGISKGSEVSMYTIAGNVALYDCDNFSGRMSAKQQREIFGVAIFGKKTITIDNTGWGRIYGTFAAGYKNTSFFDLTFEQLADRINAGLDYIS